MDILAWVIANRNAIGVLLVATHAFAVAIVNLTPTPADNRIVGRVYKWVERIGGVFTETAKEKPGEREGAAWQPEPVSGPPVHTETTEKSIHVHVHCGGSGGDPRPSHADRLRSLASGEGESRRGAGSSQGREGEVGCI